jgi:CRP-like cAMP-binding protein
MSFKQHKAVSKHGDIVKSLAKPFSENEASLRSAYVLKKISQQFSDTPEIIRLHADSLKEKGRQGAAANLYAYAAELFLKEDRISATIAHKIMQWRINLPTPAEEKDFFLNLKRVADQDTPVKSFFCQLNYLEFVTLCTQFEIVRFPQKDEVMKMGDPEDSLFFVVSGTLRDSTYLTIDNEEKFYRKPNSSLTEDDCFGDIYPFDQQKNSKSYVETESQVELLKISKEKLAKICKKHPNVELGLLNLLQIRSKISESSASDNLRITKRIQLKLEFGVEVFLKGSANTSIYLTGCSSDVSIGGVCFILDEMSHTASSEFSKFERILNGAEVQVNFPIEDLTIKIPGKISWIRLVSYEGRKTAALGIRFDKMSPKLKGLLIAFFNCFHKK